MLIITLISKCGYECGHDLYIMSSINRDLNLLTGQHNVTERS